MTTLVRPPHIHLPNLPDFAYVPLMTSKPLAGLARAVFGGFLVCVILLCSLAVINPGLHKALHPDAQSGDHICQLGVWGKDQFLASPAPSPQPPVVLTVLLPPTPVQCFSSLFDSLAFPTRGPPTLS